MGQGARRLPVQEMPRARQLPERAVLQARAQDPGVSHRDHPIVFTPEQAHHRQLVQLVQTLEQLASLAAPVDHVADGASEGARRARQAVYVPEPATIGQRQPPPVQLHEQPCDRAAQALARCLQRAAHGRQPQPPAHLSAQTSGCNQRQLAYGARPVQAEPERDPAAVGVAHHVRRPEVHTLQPAQRRASLPVEPVTRIRPPREAAARQVQTKNPVAPRELAGDPLPAVLRVSQPVQYDEWTAGPLLRPVQRHTIDDRLPRADDGPRAAHGRTDRPGLLDLTPRAVAHDMPDAVS